MTLLDALEAEFAECRGALAWRQGTTTRISAQSIEHRLTRAVDTARACGVEWGTRPAALVLAQGIIDAGLAKADGGVPVWVVPKRSTTPKQLAEAVLATMAARQLGG